MSGIYIKGMEMPDSCWNCPFHSEDICYPGDMKIARNHYYDRSKHCPLIRVPECGDLIDINELKKSLLGQTYGSDAIAVMRQIFKLINDAPIIISCLDLKGE